MKQFLTIFKFELMGYLKNKIYLGTTIFFILISGIVLSIPTILSIIDKQKEAQEPGTSDPEVIEDKDDVLLSDLTDANYYEYLAASLPQYNWIKTTDSEDAIKEKIAGENYIFAVLINSPDNFLYITQSLGMYDMNMNNVNNSISLKNKMDALTALGVNPQDSSQIVSKNYQAQLVETGKSTFENFFYTYILIFMLYMAILLYGQMVATSVAAEKSSRAMELLITSARPNNLMFGKVFGSGFSGIIQLFFLLFSAYLFYNINIDALGNNEIVSSIFNMPIEILLFTILFFICGFFLYAFMYAALGSLANRSEDVNTSILPVTFLFIIAFFVSFQGMMGDINSPLMIIASYVPFTSCMVMFVRICMSNVAWWEILLSVAILIGTTGVIGILAAKIYRIGVLLYGKPPKLKELIKILKTAK